MSPLPQEARTLAASPSEHLPETVISSDSSIRLIQSLRDLWAYRDLFRAFVARDVKVRYKQTVLGVIWIVLQPLAAAGLFTVVFQQLGVRQGTEPVNALLFFMAGLIPWNSFSSAVMNSSTSMEGNAHLITKVYFPRLVIPGAYVCGSAFDFIVAFAILIVTAVVAQSWSWLLLLMMPPLLLIQLAFSAAIGLVFGALNAQYRDVKYVVPFFLQMGMLVTVLLPLSQWKQPALRTLLSYNPMGAVIETYRSILVGEPMDFLLLFKGAAVALIGLGIGVWFFRSRESKMVDIL